MDSNENATADGMSSLLRVYGDQSMRRGNYVVEIDMDMDIHGYPRISISHVDMDGYG